MNEECMKTLRLLDRHMDGESNDAETTFVEKHLKACSACVAESGLRKALRARVRSAARAEQASPFLSTRILTHVRHRAERPVSWFGRTQLSAAAGILVLCVGAALGVHFTAESREVGFLTARVSSLMRVALGDHLHCSVHGEPPQDTLVNELPAEYIDLMPVVQQHIPPDFRLYTAHICEYNGRSFLHFGMKRGAELVSLIVTAKRAGEAFDTKEVVASLTRSGIRVYGGGVQQFQVAGFDTGKYLAYVVSDMDKERNRDLLLALGPALTDFMTARKT